MNVKEVSNISIFQFISSLNLVVPKPPIVELDDGRMMENVHNPLYNDALLVHDIERTNAAFFGVVRLCLTLDNEPELEQYRLQYETMKLHKLTKGMNFEEWVIVNFVLEDANDTSSLTQLAVLTETVVAGIFNSIKVTRDGGDIHKTQLRNAISTGIETDSIVIAGQQLVSPLDEYRACNETGMSQDKWSRCEYTMLEKATAIALYRLDKVIETHSNDIVQIHQERESRKKKK